MNIYLLEAGLFSRYVVAESEEEAYQIGSDSKLHPDLHFRHFTVNKIEVEGYTIAVTKNARTGSQSVVDMSRDELKEWLSKRSIEFTPQWGEQKLRELALQHAS